MEYMNEHALLEDILLTSSDYNFNSFPPNNYISDHHYYFAPNLSDPFVTAPFHFDFDDVPPDLFSAVDVGAQSVLPTYCFDVDGLFVDGAPNVEEIGEAPCKVETLPEMPAPAVVVPRKSGRVKKVSGQPSKNLMAERRRRKRLNDRLSMLRSVVPKISKMDRTSILGDTIDYMKELLERINTLQEDMQLGSSSSSSLSSSPSVDDNELRLMTIFKDVKPNELLVRNSPKFEVERRKEETRIEICCGGKPGLVLSTVTTLEALGLEIKHCVISCFNDFSLQASCSHSQELKKRTTMIDSEDIIKQALLRNAGYGGKCL